MLRRTAQVSLLALGVLAVVELVCFAFFRLARDRFAFADPERYVLSPDRIEPLRPGFDAELGWVSHFETRHGERPHTASYGHAFMATFGDSHVFCDEVGDEETWQTYLAESLQADVLNFGVSGYGPDQALLRMRRVSAGLRTPTYALGLGLENINRIVNRYRPFYFAGTGLPLPKPRFVLVDSRLRLIPNPVHTAGELDRLTDPAFIQKLGEHDEWYTRRDLPRLGFPYCRLLVDPRIWRQALDRRQRRSDNDPVPRANLWREEGPRRLYFALMDAFAADAEAAGGRALFVLPPGRALAEARREGRGIPGYNRVLQHCRERGYDCFDGIEWLHQAVGDEEPLDDDFRPGGHCSPRGNQVTADGLRRFLEARGLRPPPVPKGGTR